MFNQEILINSQVVEINLSYSHTVPIRERMKITNHTHAVEAFRSVWDERTIELYESFKVMLLNRNNRLLGVVSISTGGMAGTVCDIRLIFAIALKAAAHSILLAHNHPSGNLKPSEVDIRLTKKVQEVGIIMDILLQDHIILTKEDHFSFASGNML